MRLENRTHELEINIFEEIKPENNDKRSYVSIDNTFILVPIDLEAPLELVEILDENVNEEEVVAKFKNDIQILLSKYGYSYETIENSTTFTRGKHVIEMGDYCTAAKEDTLLIGVFLEDGDGIGSDIEVELEEQSLLTFAKDLSGLLQKHEYRIIDPSLELKNTLSFKYEFKN